MNIIVASGKGGTGKTLVAANLASAISDTREVLLVDCDVEEPNLHLFFAEGGYELPVTTPVPVFDPERCTACGKCAGVCRYGAITVLKDPPPLFFEKLCHSCGGCEMICPEGAIHEEERTIGKLRFSIPRDNIILISGILNEGEVMAPKVIGAAKSYAKGHPLTILDASPGIACPVVEAMQGADYCILVTESTPFGLHDLALAESVTRCLGIPSGVVINRYSEDDDEVIDFCREKDLPVLMTIPFNRDIARIQNTGGLISDKIPAYKQEFVRLFSRVLEGT
jgi:MinD superfamily P-loop ATPase